MPTLTLGVLIAFIGPILHWNELADPYSSFKFLFLAILCFSVVLTQYPKRGMLTVASLVYFAALVLFSLIAFKEISFVGRKLNYGTSVLSMALVGIAYHYSIGDKWEKIADAFIASCLIISVVGILNLWTPQGAFFGKRIYAFIGSPVFLSGTLAMAVPLCLGRGRLLFLIPVLLCAIFLTQSRAGFVSAAAGCVGYAYARGLIGAKGAAFLAGLALVLTLGMFAKRNTVASDMGRYQMARVALMTAADNPLGIGPERFGWALLTYKDKAFTDSMGESYHNGYTHNSLLEALVAGGPIFLAVHSLLMLIVALFLLRNAPPSVYGCACALFAFGLTQPTPLLVKVILASLAGACDPSHYEMPRARPLFVAGAFAAFLASLFAVSGSKIYVNGQRAGLADMVIDSFNESPSSKGEQ